MSRIDQIRERHSNHCSSTTDITFLLAEIDRKDEALRNADKDARFASAVRALADQHRDCPVLQLRDGDDCSILGDIDDEHRLVYGGPCTAARAAQAAKEE